MYKYVIVGAGVAGISAIEAIRTIDTSGEITQVCDEAAGYYSRPGLAYYLTGEVTEDCLFPFTDGDFKRLKITHEKAEVLRIIPQEHRIQLQNGKFISYNRLLIATGAHAAQPKIPGADLRGVVKLDSLEDAHQIIKYARKKRKAVVVGGGITALELVEAFRARGMNVQYFLRGDRYWSNVLDKTESNIVEHRLKSEGIQIHYQTELAEILGERGQVSGVLTSDGKKIACDVVGIAIGILPRKMLAESAGLKTGRGILVNEYLSTSDLDIFAAGDVAEVYDPILGKATLDSLWRPAREQGYTAGLNMTGKRISYSKNVPFNVTRLAGLTTTIIGGLGGREEDADTVGIVRGSSEGWREMPDALVAQADFDVNRLRVLVGENHLVGAILMGDQTLSRAIHYLVANKVDISPIRGKLLATEHILTDVIADFWADIHSSNGSDYHATDKS